ncbi:MAG: IS110 family transposase [bacterium]
MSANITNFIGIDISKLKVDVAIIKNNDKSSIVSETFENNIEGMKKLSCFIEKKHQLDLSQTIFCMEHTGIYNRCILNYLTEKQCMIWLEMPVQIIKSIGLQRGKSDKMDAQKIALYAYKNKEDIKLWQPKRAVINQIHELLTLRDRLTETENILQVPINEIKSIGDKSTATMVHSHCKKTLNAIQKDLSDVNDKLDDIVKNDQNVKRLYALSTSIPGIGRITTLKLICYTNEFNEYVNGKQLACYCGIAPFEHSSGSSVKGKTRVSNMANKQLKTVLHLGALSVIRSNGELKEYYLRKVAEGKNKMSVINAVRNKMLLRLSAVIRRGTPYEKNFAFAK